MKTALNPIEKQEMFKRALSKNPGLTFNEFEENLKKHRNPALEKANPNTQHHRTVNGVVLGYKSQEDMHQTFTESDVYDNE